MSKNFVLIIITTSLFLTATMCSVFACTFFLYSSDLVKAASAVSFFAVLATNVLLTYKYLKITRKEQEEKIRYEIAHEYRTKFDNHYAEFLAKYGESLASESKPNGK